MRRHWAGIAALILVALGVLLALFAADVRTWQTTVQRDDIRFRALPNHAGLWQPATVLPGDPAAAALGTGDTLAWRHALQSFWLMHIGADPEAREDLPALRAAAQQRLLKETRTAATPTERSAAANLLGVISITTPVAAGSNSAIEATLREAAEFFQRAIQLDPSNVDAKENLELVLRITRPGKGRLGADAHAGFGFGRGQASKPVGNGY
jgi:hypothetical protein